MANLNPLAFKVEIQDEATTKLTLIQTQLENLNDKTIKVQVGGIEDLRTLLQMLGQQATPKIGEKVSQEMDEAKGKVKSLEQEIQTLQQAMQRMPQDNIALQSHLKEINSCIQANREFRKELANPQGLDSNYLSQLPNAIQHNIGVIKTELEKLKVLSRGSGFDQSWLTTIQRRVDAENELISVQQRSSQSSQQQTQNVKQVGDAAQTTSEQLQKLAQSAIKGSFEQFINDLSEVKKAVQNDNFTAFSKRVEACAESIKKLTEAFSQFKTTIGENKDLKDIMAGWGAAIREVSAAMAAMNATKGAGSASNKKQNDEIRQQEEGLIKVVNALGRVREATAGGGSGAGVPFMENITKVGERNIQTLIREQGHIERLIAIAKKSIDFGEGHPVLGMGRLRGDQMQNLQYLEQLKKVINEILFAANQGDQVAIRFLNTLGSLKTTPFGKDQMGNDVTLLGGHFDKLTHSVTGTATAMRQLNNDMRLDNADQYKQWNTENLTRGLYRVDGVLSEIKKRWEDVKDTAGKDIADKVASQISRLTSLRQMITTAMNNTDLLRTRNGYGSIINADFTNQISQARDLARELGGVEKANTRNGEAMRKSARDAETEIKRIEKIIERLNALRSSAAGRTDTSGIDTLLQKLSVLKRDYQDIVNGNGKNRLGNLFSDFKNLPSVRDVFFGIGDVFSQATKGIKEYEQAQKSLKDALDATERKINQVKDAITRGTTAGRDMSSLENALSTLEGKRLLLSKTGVNETTFRSRLEALLKERDTIETLRKSEEKLTAERERANRRNDNAALKNIDKEAESVNQAYVQYNKLSTKIVELQALQDRGQRANIDTTAVEKYIELLKQERQLMNEIIANGGRTTAANSFNLRAGMLTSEALKHNNLLGEEAFKKLHLGEFNKELSDAEKRMNAAGAAARGLDKKIQDLEARKVNFQGLDTSRLDAAIQKIQRIQNELSNFSRSGQSAFGSNAFEISKNMGLAAANREVQNSLRELTGTQRENERTARQNAQAAQQLTFEQQKLAQALNQTTQAAHGQSQVLSDLKSMATQYLGVWGGQQFIHNIIETGGQLEMQRLSIGAILQDTAHANELFERIKNLATQSPFGVVQLDQMTKQLTAYGFKYNELYDMTNRLANISAATGTSVDRLALALGHVRSEAALSGYTLRQFAMGNVPLLAKLSEKLGKTSKEIRDMVKKKEIGYEDVVGVLKDLTNEGGMFYNMQEVISESVKAKFKNVRDAMDIMYGEMAEGTPGDALKEVANVLMELTRGWKDVATVLGTTAAVWGVHKAGILAVNAALGQNTAAVSANILSYKKKRATELQNEALTRKLTAEELALVATRKKITAENVRVALSTNAMTKGEALRLVGLRKLSLEEAKALIRSGEFTAAEVRMAIQGRVLGMNLGYAGNMMRYFATSAKMAMAALLSNPWTWAMAGVTAAVELWQRNSRELERTKELNDDIYNRSQEGLKNTRLMMQNTGIRVDWRKDEKDKWSDVTGTFGQQTGGIMRFVKPDFEKNDDIEGTIEAWQQYIRDYAATRNRIINDAMTSSETVKGEDGIEKVTTKIREQREQYDLLYESVINVSRAQQQMASLGDDMEFAVNDTNKGWLDEDLLTNIGDYDEQVKKVSQNIGKTYADLRNHIDKTIRKAQKEDQDFANATKGMDNYAQAFDLLVKKHKEYSKADEIFKNASFGVSSAYESLLDGSLFDSGTMSGLDSAKKTMEDDLNQFFASLENQLRTKKYWHIDEVIAGKMTLSEDKQQALLSSWKDTLSKVPRLTDETARELTEKFAERYHIQIDADTENAIVKLSMLEQSLNNLVNGDYKVNIESMTNSDAVFDKLKKDYKAAKTFIETSKPILAKFGISFTGKALSKDQIDKALAKIADENIREEVGKILEGFNQAVGELGKTEEAANNIGLKLEDEKKNKKKSGTTKAYKDEFAKRWDERIRIMKEAYDWYDKWEKKVGNDEAIKEVNAKYADIFAEWSKDTKLPMTFRGEDIKEYTKYVEQIRDDALARYQSQTSTEANRKKFNNGQEALRVYRQAVSLLNDVKFDKFTKAAEDFKSIIDQTIEDLNERWDIFNTVRDATGNVGLASSVAGFGAAEKNARTSADAMRNELQSLLLKAGGENLLGLIPLDINIDDESLRKQFEQAIPQTGDVERYKEKIDGLVKAYQEWQKLQRKVVKDDISTFANLIGSVVSYDAKIKKIRDNLRKQKESIANAVGADGKPLSQKDKDNATAIAKTQADWEEMKLSADYANIYNNAIAMSRTEFNDAANAIERMLKKLRELELISPEDYVSEREKLNKARNEWSATGFLGERGAVGQFISGGYEGLLNYYAERRDKARQQEKNAKQGSEEQKRYAKEAEHYGKLFDRMSKLSDSTKDVITAFQTLQAGLDLVTNLFDSLGMEGAANVAGDASGILGSGLQGAQSLSALGPWGMAAGAALGLVSGIAQTHDKALERQIGKLREDVQKIEENTKLIQQARERTLGFDTGELRMSYAQDYKPNIDLSKYPLGWPFLTPFDSTAQKDMYEYYERNSSGTGYQQEYQNLLDQRKDYLEILDAQESKKKKSQSDIEETKGKIAELDDQIRYFTQDLAKELFSIDIKGWADQLSDALASAFENGENMAKTYKDTVRNILQQVMQKMMQLKILEPMFESLQEKLFGKNGVFNPADPKGSLGKITSVITDFFGKGGEGEKTITAATEFMAAFQRGVQNSGLSILNDTSNTLSSGIQGTSEETSDLLAGYVNALRQDVSVNRILLNQFIVEHWPSYVEEFKKSVKSLSNIDNNTRTIMEMMESGRGAMYEQIASLRQRFDNVVNGIENLSVR